MKDCVFSWFFLSLFFIATLICCYVAKVLIFDSKKLIQKAKERKKQMESCNNCASYLMKFKGYKKTAPYCKKMEQFLQDNEACSEYETPETCETYACSVF